MRIALLLLASTLTLPAVHAATPAPLLAVQDDVPTMADARALLDAGNFKGAAVAYGKISKAEPKNGQAVFMHAYTLHAAGDLVAALRRHGDAAKFEAFRPVALYNEACVHSLQGHADAAFASLGKSLEAGFDDVDQLETDPDMDNIRDDARFKAIIAKLSGEEPPPTPVPASAPKPEQAVPTIQAARALLGAGDFKGAATAFGAISKADPKNGQAVFLHAFSLHSAGDLKAAHDRHLEAAEFEDFRALALYNHACVHSLWGEADVAVRSLREAMDAGFSDPDQLETDTDMDNIREDARFKAIVAELSGEAPPAPAPAGGPLDLASLDPAKRFDWYIGTWQMMNGDALEQTVIVERAFGGKGLQVTMSDTQGNETARAIYSYDANQGVWRQVWMSAAGQVISMAGGLADGDLALRVDSDSTGNSLNGRSVFGDVSRDTFEYSWQTTPDEGKTWEIVATRSFVRR